MSETEIKKNNGKKIGIGIAILVVLIAAALIIYFVAKPKPVEGAKALTIEVVDDQGASTTYEVHTDAEYLRQALEETEGLTCLLYTSPSPRDRQKSRMPSSA